MAVISFETEIVSSIPAAKLFEAFVTAHNLIPKFLGPVFHGAEAVEEISEGNQYKTVRHKIEILGTDNFAYSHSVVEGNELASTFEMIIYEVKVTASSRGGSVCNNKSKCFTREITEDKRVAVKEKVCGMLKAMEAYLVANPSD